MVLEIVSTSKCSDKIPLLLKFFVTLRVTSYDIHCRCWILQPAVSCPSTESLLNLLEGLFDGGLLEIGIIISPQGQEGCTYIYRIEICTIYICKSRAIEIVCDAIGSSWCTIFAQPCTCRHCICLLY